MRRRTTSCVHSYFPRRASVRLGAFNGLQLVIQAKLDHPTVTAVVLTGFYDPVLSGEVSKMGASYLVKPIRSEQLLEKLR